MCTTIHHSPAHNRQQLLWLVVEVPDLVHSFRTGNASGSLGCSILILLMRDWLSASSDWMSILRSGDLFLSGLLLSGEPLGSRLKISLNVGILAGFMLLLLNEVYCWERIQPATRYPIMRARTQR
jgi:hypothetical protein